MGTVHAYPKRPRPNVDTKHYSGAVRTVIGLILCLCFFFLVIIRVLFINLNLQLPKGVWVQQLFRGLAVSLADFYGRFHLVDTSS